MRAPVLAFTFAVARAPRQSLTRFTHADDDGEKETRVLEEYIKQTDSSSRGDLVAAAAAAPLGRRGLFLEPRCRWPRRRPPRNIRRDRR